MASPKLQQALVAKLGKHEANELLALIEGSEGEVALTPWTENVSAAGFDLTNIGDISGQTVAGVGQAVTIAAGAGVGDFNAAGNLTIKAGSTSGELMATAGHLSLEAGVDGAGMRGNVTIVSNNLSFDYAQAMAIADATDGTDVITQLNAVLSLLRAIGLVDDV